VAISIWQMIPNWRQRHAAPTCSRANMKKQYAINLGDAHKILQELLGAIAADVHIKPPFFVDYGRYITIGAGDFCQLRVDGAGCSGHHYRQDVLLGPNVQLLTPTHPVDIESRRAKYEAAKPIVIHDNAWLGGGVIVLAGVTIGENSVIGAGSVVTKDIPANAVAVGNPARVIRMIE
jgi:maltose O-acetyltransferase